MEITTAEMTEINAGLASLYNFLMKENEYITNSIINLTRIKETKNRVMALDRPILPLMIDTISETISIASNPSRNKYILAFLSSLRFSRRTTGRMKILIPRKINRKVTCVLSSVGGWDFER
ncbi:hypothetical protein [Ligilactobacillus murinus]|uniref:hypothetical protein n=1 Tax=Ligilactobacillus murinus TaxID=1622 RepID=UPI001094D2C7|nr:hypothetical protein [Ligilactobacillus murinus]TGY53932.1 hypothetical protein E5341_00530 [Ligilactobacillus murinus]